MSGTVEIPRGFSGKIPARGDFVHAGLPRDFIDPWHDWQSLVIAGSRTLMGDGWLDALLVKPTTLQTTEKIGKEVYFWVNKAFLQEVFGDVADYLKQNL